MFHRDVTPDIAEGLLELRTRIAAAEIPASKLDETLNLATWNIREFGRKPRMTASLHYIAEILGQFDLIAVTEVRDDLTDLGRVLQILGPYWRVVFSDWNPDRAGNRERIAYVYDERAATFTGLAAEPDPPRKKNAKGVYRPSVTWWRSPYMASFRAGNFDFILITAHIRWGASAAARVKPLKALGEWIHKRRGEAHVVDKDILLMGDFNIPSTDDATYKALTRKGLSIPEPLRGVHGTNLAKEKRYDQILHYPAHEGFFTGAGGTLDFYADNVSRLFPNQRLTKRAFTYQLSDHLPLWIQLDTDNDDEELEQILNAPRRPRRRR